MRSNLGEREQCQASGSCQATEDALRKQPPEFVSVQCRRDRRQTFATRHEIPRRVDTLRSPIRGDSGRVPEL